MKAVREQSRALFLAGVALMAGFGAGTPAHASDLELVPSLSVAEEFDDNIFETAAGQKGEFTTRVQPRAALHYRTPSLSLDSSYAFEYRNYANGSHGDEQIHNLDVKGSLQLFHDFLFLEVGDNLQRVSANVARDLATESLLATQTTRNIASVSPYLLWHPTEKGVLRTGFRYTDTSYRGPGIDKKEHVAFADLEHTLSARTTLTAGYAFTDGEAAQLSYDRHDFSAGLRYAYAETSFIFGQIGNSWQSFSGGIRTSDLFWNAGVTHDFGSLVALLETRVENTEDPTSASTRQVSYTGRLDKPLPRGGIGLAVTYAEYLLTATGEKEQRKLTASVTGRYEVSPRLSATATGIFERLSHVAPSSYPNRITSSAGLSYAIFNEYSAVSLFYTSVVNYASNGATANCVSNRVFLELRTVFDHAKRAQH